MSEDIDRYYGILELTPGASPAEVERAFQTLMRALQPERYIARPGLQRRAAEKLQAITEARDILVRHLGQPGAMPTPGKATIIDFTAKRKARGLPAEPSPPPPDAEPDAWAEGADGDLLYEGGGTTLGDEGVQKMGQWILILLALVAIGFMIVAT